MLVLSVLAAVASFVAPIAAVAERRPPGRFSELDGLNWEPPFIFHYFALNSTVCKHQEACLACIKKAEAEYAEAVALNHRALPWTAKDVYTDCDCPRPWPEKVKTGSYRHYRHAMQREQWWVRKYMCRMAFTLLGDFHHVGDTDKWRCYPESGQFDNGHNGRPDKDSHFEPRIHKDPADDPFPDSSTYVFSVSWTWPTTEPTIVPPSSVTDTLVPPRMTQPVPLPSVTSAAPAKSHLHAMPVALLHAIAKMPPRLRPPVPTVGFSEPVEGQHAHNMQRRGFFGELPEWHQLKMKQHRQRKQQVKELDPLGQMPRHTSHRKGVTIVPCSDLQKKTLMPTRDVQTPTPTTTMSLNASATVASSKQNQSSLSGEHLLQQQENDFLLWVSRLDQRDAEDNLWYRHLQTALEEASATYDAHLNASRHEFHESEVRDQTTELLISIPPLGVHVQRNVSNTTLHATHEQSSTMTTLVRRSVTEQAVPSLVAQPLEPRHHHGDKPGKDMSQPDHRKEPSFLKKLFNGVGAFFERVSPVGQIVHVSRERKKLDKQLIYDPELHRQRKMTEDERYAEEKKIVNKVVAQDLRMAQVIPALLVKTMQHHKKPHKPHEHDKVHVHHEHKHEHEHEQENVQEHHEDNDNEKDTPATLSKRSHRDPEVATKPLPELDEEDNTLSALEKARKRLKWAKIDAHLAHRKHRHEMNHAYLLAHHGRPRTPPFNGDLTPDEEHVLLDKLAKTHPELSAAIAKTDSENAAHTDSGVHHKKRNYFGWLGIHPHGHLPKHLPDVAGKGFYALDEGDDTFSGDEKAQIRKHMAKEDMKKARKKHKHDKAFMKKLANSGTPMEECRGVDCITAGQEKKLLERLRKEGRLVDDAAISTGTTRTATADVEAPTLVQDATRTITSAITQTVTQLDTSTTVSKAVAFSRPVLEMIERVLKPSRAT